MVDPEDRGPVFDGVRIGRPATGALVDAGDHSAARAGAGGLSA
jgi:hypothetical protein